MRHVLLLLLPVACTQPPPGADDARAYVTTVEPLVYENGLLARTLLGVAADVHDGEATPQALTRWWTDETVPLTQHLAHQAAAASAPAGWTEQHRDLVTVWEERADAYQALDQALKSGDEAAWSAGRAAADRAKIREEEWFRSADEALAPFGLALDQYP